MKRMPQELLQRILQVRAGNLTVTEAARQLGLSRKTYYEKEARALQAMLAALTPETPGRPTKAEPTEAERLRSENDQLRQQLEVLEQRIQIKEWLARAETRAEKK
jgi:transposase-like protein